VHAQWFVNGQSRGVDPSDRGLAYGDGLFETMAAVDGRIRWLDLHLERLGAGCRQLGIEPVDVGTIRDEIIERCPPHGRWVLKLIVTRGPGARGYRPPVPANPARILGIVPWPEAPRSHYTQGIRMGLCKLRLGRNAHLAGLKHLCRLEQVLAQRELIGSDVEEGLLLDTDGLVVSGTSCNVFAVFDGRLTTPALTHCGVKGVMRRVVLASAGRLCIGATEQDIGAERLPDAEEVFVTNAISGIRPVQAIGERRYAIGAITLKLMSELGYPDDA
jgi:4-amino-4-deoxychorismate lyase